MNSDESSWVPEELRNARPARHGPPSREAADWLPESAKVLRDDDAPADQPAAAEAPLSPQTSEWLVIPEGPSGSQPAPPSSTPGPAAEPAEAKDEAPPAEATRGESETAPARPAPDAAASAPAVAIPDTLKIEAATRTAIAEAERAIREGAEARLAAERERSEGTEERARELETKLRDAERQIERLQAQLSDSDEGRRLAENAQAEAEAAREQAAGEAAAHQAQVAELTNRVHELERAERAARQRMLAATGGNRDEAGRVELNTATVEALRDLGLSITQAARVVAVREARGGFASIEDLDAVPGLPEKRWSALRERIYVETPAVGGS